MLDFALTSEQLQLRETAQRFAATEIMPIDACLYFYECQGCHKLLRPKAGDCCVFCSFGSDKCPSIQLAQRCCNGSSSAHGA